MGKTSEANRTEVFRVAALWWGMPSTARGVHTDVVWTGDWIPTWGPMSDDEDRDHTCAVGGAVAEEDGAVGAQVATPLHQRLI